MQTNPTSLNPNDYLDRVCPVNYGRGIVSKRCKITRKRMQVLDLLLKGHSNDEIAFISNQSVRTVKVNIRVLCGILGINPTNRIRLVHYWNCELFQIGIKELNLLKEDAYEDVKVIDIRSYMDDASKRRLSTIDMVGSHWGDWI